MSREGGYATRKRAEILTYLKDCKDKEVSVSDIQEYLQEKQMEVNVTTIYRYLEKLLEQGMIIKNVNSVNNKAVFQYIGGNEHCHEHLHLKCEKCGRIYHLDCEFMHSIARHIGDDHGFHLDCQHSVITGFCEQCYKK